LSGMSLTAYDLYDVKKPLRGVYVTQEFTRLPRHPNCGNNDKFRPNVFRTEALQRLKRKVTSKCP
jgi:hypothetical protein